MAASEGILLVLAIPVATAEQPQRYYVVRAHNSAGPEGKLAGKLQIDGSILAIAGNYEEAVQIWRNLA